MVDMTKYYARARENDKRKGVAIKKNNAAIKKSGVDLSAYYEKARKHDAENPERALLDSVQRNYSSLVNRVNSDAYRDETSRANIDADYENYVQQLRKLSGYNYDVSGAMDDARELRSYIDDSNAYFSQFKNNEEYRASVDAWEDVERLSSMSLLQQQSEIDKTRKAIEAGDKSLKGKLESLENDYRQAKAIKDNAAANEALDGLDQNAYNLIDALAMGEFNASVEGRTENINALLDMGYSFEDVNQLIQHRLRQVEAEQGKLWGESINEKGALGKAISTGSLSLLSGFDQFVQGIKQIGKEEALPTTYTQYASDTVERELGTAGKYLYKSGQMVGNMLPSIAVGMAVPGAGKIAASATIGASAAGNAYGEKVSGGYDPQKARTYAALIGASEAGLSYLLSGISAVGGKLGVSGKLASKIDKIDNALARIVSKGALSIGSEVTEEELQLFIEPALNSIVFGEDYDVPTIEAMLETAIVSAITTGALEGPSIVSNHFANRDAYEQYKKRLADAELPVEAPQMPQETAETEMPSDTPRVVGEETAQNVGKSVGKKAVGSEVIAANDLVYQAATEKFGSDLAHVVAAGYKTAGDVKVSEYLTGFNAAYEAGKKGVSVEEAIAAAPTIQTEVAQEAWQLGMEEKNTRVVTRSIEQQGSGKVTDETKGKATESWSAYVTLQKAIAQRLGADINLVDEVVTEKGAKANAALIRNTMTFVLSRNSQHMIQDMGHEMAEFVEAYNPEGMDELRNDILAYWSRTQSSTSVRAMVKKYQSAYQKGEGSKTYEQAETEALNDAIGAILSSEEGVDSLINWLETDSGLNAKEQKTFLQKLGDLLRGIVESLKKLVNNGKLTPMQRDMVQMEISEKQSILGRFLSAVDTAAVSAKESGEYYVELAEAGVGVDEETNTVFSLRFSTAYTDKVKVGKQTFDTEAIVKAVAEGTGRSETDARKWVESEMTLANIIMQDPEFLDFEPDARYEAIKKNSDYPQGTVDLSNLCPKREELTAIYDRLQKKYPDKLFTAADLAEMRQILSDHDLVVACGACFVEDRRQLVGEIAATYIDMWKEAIESGKTVHKVNASGNRVPMKVTAKIAKLYGVQKGAPLLATDTYVPTQYDLTTYEGFRVLQQEHPTVAMGFELYNNSRGQQAARLIEGRAEYDRQILGWSDAKVKRVNNNGGLRIFSFSDFEVVHLLDLVQVIMDCSARGVKIQGYTKIPAFARLVRNTGIKINRSLIPKGDTGIKVVNGKRVLDIDTVEGIDINDKNFLEERDNPNVGNIIIGVNNEQIGIAMLDDFIDYIIPFHSNKSKEILKKLGTGAWVNYKESQHDKDIATGKASKHNVNIYTEVLAKYHPKNKVEFVNAFLKECKAQGKIPRYSELLNRDENGEYTYREGYHKLLVDFKMFDTEGNLLPQGEIVPELDNEFMQELLSAEVDRKKNYEFPQEVYDEIEERVVNKYVVGGDASYSLSDVDYLDAVERGDMDTAQKMVDEAAKAAGYTIKGHHGTTNLFTVFDTSKSNIENDWGRGIYATTSEEDAETNYASDDGADLTNRIERLAEMMENWEEYEDMDYEQRVEAARNQLSQGENRMLRVAIRMENPVVVERGSNGTFFTYESEYDEDADEYSEPSGTLLEVVEQMQSIIEEEYEWASYDADKLNDLFMEAIDYGGMSAIQLQSAGDDALIDVSDEDGNLAGKEILRAALERMGFDGIIDKSVPYKFGELSGRRYGGMRGVAKDTTHYIAFNSSQVKLADPVTYDDNGNVIPLSERFNAENDDIRYSLSSDGESMTEMTNREILEAAANANEGVTEGEKDALKIFQKRLKKLNDLQAKRKELGAAWQKQQFGGDRNEAVKTRNRMKVVDGQIENAEKELIAAEKSGTLQGVVDRARKEGAKVQKKHDDVLMKRYRDRRKDAEATKKYRDRITKKVKKLSDMLLKNSDKQHIPEVLKGLVGEFISTIDFTSKQQLRGGEATQKDRKFINTLDKIHTVLDKQAKLGDEGTTDFDAYLDLPDGFTTELKGYIDKVRGAIEGKDIETPYVNMMSAAELEDLDFIVGVIYNSINKANELLANARYKSVSDAAETTIFELAPLKEHSGKSGVGKFLNWDNTTPVYAFKRFGAGGRAIFEGLQDGWDKFALNAKAVIDFAKKIYTAKEVKEWSNKVHTFEIDGREVQMTTTQVMSLYCLMKREQAQGHIFGGGMRIGNFATENGRLKKKSSVQQTDAVHPTLEHISTILNVLTDRQIAVADALQNYMNTVGTEWGNAVSMARFGYKAFGEENYFPIVSDSNNLPSQDPGAKTSDLYRLLNMCFTKSLTPKANNALVVDDIFEVFAAHMSDMAKYNALALPVLDAMKFYNYKQTTKEGEKLFTSTVQKAIEKAYGKDGQSYFIQFMKDLNGVHDGGRSSVEKLSMKMVSNYKIASVGANLRVAFLQPTSLLRAGVVIDPKYLAKALTMKPAVKEMLEHSGIAVWKDLGFYDVDIGRGVRDQIKHEESFRDKAIDKSMIAAEMMDRVTWGALWNACKLECTVKGEKDLTAATAKRFREVVYASQVVDSTMTRSQTMRSNSSWTKILTSFMSEPTLSFNTLLDVYNEYETNKRKGIKNTWENSGKKIARGLLAYGASAAGAAVAESIFDALRDDDDYETFLEKFWEAFWMDAYGYDGKKEFGNLLSDLNPANKLPIIKDVFNEIVGFENNRMDTQWLTSISDAIAAWKSESRPLYGKIYKTLQAVSRATGLPISNLSRGAATIYNITIGTLTDKKLKTWEPTDYKGIKDAFKAGHLTKEEAAALLVKKCGYTASKAKSKTAAWEYQSENPDTALSDSRQVDFVTYARPAGISVDVFQEYVDGVKAAEGKDIDGDGESDKKAIVVKLINGLPISKKQKDVLYLLDYAENGLYETPWH